MDWNGEGLVLAPLGLSPTGSMDEKELAATMIGISRSFVFWEVLEICAWFEALQFDREVRR